jgi:hemerythrin
MPRVLPFAAVLMLCLWFGASQIYPWAMPEWAHNHHVHGRHPWLNPTFFFLRVAIFFGLWLTIGRALLRRHKLAAPFIAVFAATFALASFDWIMSLQPLWYSTIFAIYGFAGMFVQGIALLTLSAIALRHFGLVRGVAHARNHDLGKLLFAFSCFWAYIWLSQFLLIWYANIPEETAPVKAMLHGEWGTAFYLNLGLNFIVPFFLLITRKAKQNETVLIWASVILLVGHWHDLYLLVFPAMGKDAGPSFGLAELGGILLTLGAGHLAVWSRLTRTRPTVWDDAMATGASLFDDQHKMLHDRVNELFDLIEGFKPGLGQEKQIASGFKAFVGELKAHIETEEAYMAKVGHALAADHQRAHHDYLLTLERLLGRNEYGPSNHEHLLVALGEFRMHFDTVEEQSLLDHLRQPASH